MSEFVMGIFGFLFGVLFALLIMSDTHSERNIQVACYRTNMTTETCDSLINYLKEGE